MLSLNQLDLFLICIFKTDFFSKLLEIRETSVKFTEYSRKYEKTDIFGKILQKLSANFYSYKNTNLFRKRCDIRKTSVKITGIICKIRNTEKILKILQNFTVNLENFFTVHSAKSSSKREL